MLFYYHSEFINKFFRMDRNMEIKFSQELLDKISKIPNLPGIYQYFNKQKKIIYIGKAKNLRNRVRTYFHSFNSMTPKTLALVEKIEDIEIIIVDNEAEALILEDTLIKKYKPQYNIFACSTVSGLLHLWFQSAWFCSPLLPVHKIIIKLCNRARSVFCSALRWFVCFVRYL